MKGKAKILLVDDEVGILDTLEILFRSEGYEVAIATTTYNDVIASSFLGELLPSDTWIGPPDDNTSLYPDGPLQGLTYISNGIMAGIAKQYSHAEMREMAKYLSTLDTELSVVTQPRFK